MKTLITIVIAFILSQSFFAQDLVVKTNHDSLKCIITGEDTSVVYQKMNRNSVAYDTFFLKRDIVSKKQNFYNDNVQTAKVNKPRFSVCLAVSGGLAFGLGKSEGSTDQEKKLMTILKWDMI